MIKSASMTIQQFEEISMTLGIGSLILYMLFILYRLGKDSGAGSYGMFIIFFSLGLGIVGFAAKSVIQLVINV